MSCVAAVRTLCEFTARAGDLDLRFTPAPTGQEGVAGHGVVTGRRGPGYETEIALSGEYGELLVRGRADGDPAAKRLEEIKTYRGRLDSVREPPAAHWAQAKVYGHLLCQARGLPSLTVALVYFNVATEEETMLVETHPAAELEAFFNAQCERYLAWARQEQAHRGARDAALAALRFPHEFRSGQRELAVPPPQARDGGCLLAQAPTGIGKTLGTLFPLLKAAPEAGLDKLFFLAAKGPGRAGAAGAGHAERAAGPACGCWSCRRATSSASIRTRRAMASPARWREASTTACRRPRRRWRTAAWTPPRCARSRRRDVCPYYLAQELTRWSDVVVGDYNYYYDATAMLHALTQASQWKVAVLADEAHNLVDRARRMYTAELSQATLAGARQAAPSR